MAKRTIHGFERQDALNLKQIARSGVKKKGLFLPEPRTNSSRSYVVVLQDAAPAMTEDGGVFSPGEAEAKVYIRDSGSDTDKQGHSSDPDNTIETPVELTEVLDPAGAYVYRRVFNLMTVEAPAGVPLMATQDVWGDLYIDQTGGASEGFCLGRVTESSGIAGSFIGTGGFLESGTVALYWAKPDEVMPGFYEIRGLDLALEVVAYNLSPLKVSVNRDVRCWFNAVLNQWYFEPVYHPFQGGTPLGAWNTDSTVIGTSATLLEPNSVSSYQNVINTSVANNGGGNGISVQTAGDYYWNVQVEIGVEDNVTSPGFPMSFSLFLGLREFKFVIPTNPLHLGTVAAFNHTLELTQYAQFGLSDVLTLKASCPFSSGVHVVTRSLLIPQFGY